MTLSSTEYLHQWVLICKYYYFTGFNKELFLCITTSKCTTFEGSRKCEEGIASPGDNQLTLCLCVLSSSRTLEHRMCIVCSDCRVQPLLWEQLVFAAPRCCAAGGRCGCSGCGGPPSGSALPCGRRPPGRPRPEASTDRTSCDFPPRSCSTHTRTYTRTRSISHVKALTW